MPSAKFVLQHAEFGFTANLPLEITLAENFLLATHYDGQPITPDHGYPLRGIIGAIVGRSDLKVPYFWKGAKWLRGLEFLKEDRLGFWEQAGYHNKARCLERRTVAIITGCGSCEPHKSPIPAPPRINTAPIIPRRGDFPTFTGDGSIRL